MKAFLDTSVLVPVFMADHVHHRASLDTFLRFKRHESSCAAHSLAETYSTLTRLPGKHRVSGEQAMLLLEEIRERLTLVALDEAEYYTSIERASGRGMRGGAIYDAILASCALKVKADALYTWNVQHFQQLDVFDRIRTP